MAFNLDFAHLPSIEIPKLAPVENGYTDVTKTLTDKMTSDPWSLFSNPMTTDTNFIGDGVAKIEMYVKNVADGSITNPNFTSGDATTYLATDPFEDLRSSLGNFMMHTGRLSGLIRSQGTQSPGLDHIMSIGLQMQNMLSILGASSDCLAVLGGATGLFSSDTFKSYTNDLATLMGRLERGVATLADITDQLAQISNAIQGIMDKDSQFLQNCINQLQSAALGLTMEALNGNPCAHFIFDTISNTNPGGFLNILAKRTT